MFSTLITRAQNLFENGDFEYYTSCPDGISQAYKVIGWMVFAESPDYFNCSFDTSPVDESTTYIYSGEGSIGLLSSFHEDKSYSESIGQILKEPLLPNVLYKLDLVAKTPNNGSYSDKCKELELYGFADLPPVDTSFEHLSEKDNARFLGKSNRVNNKSWRVYSVAFIPDDTLRVIGLSISNGGCNQYIVIDDLNLIALDNNENNDRKMCKLFPNPASTNSNVEIISNEKINSIIIYDLKGILVSYFTVENKSYTFSISKEGIYFVVVKYLGKTMIKKLIVIKN